MNKIDMTTQISEPHEGRFKVLHRAIGSAVLWHNGQDRKYSQIPYIVHPLSVMQIVRSVTDDEDMLVAAVFHDTVEDTPVKIEIIENLYGSRVAELVGWLTDVSTLEDGNRRARKQLDLEHTANAPADAQTIKLADMIDNTRSITHSDPDFARVYMKEKERLLAVLTKGHSSLQSDAQVLLRDYQEGLLQEALRHG